MAQTDIIPEAPSYAADKTESSGGTLAGTEGFTIEFDTDVMCSSAKLSKTAAETINQTSDVSPILEQG